MHSTIQKILFSQGFTSVPLNLALLQLYTLSVNGQHYAVITIDETTHTLLTTEQFHHIQEQISSYLIQHKQSPCTTLYLLMTSRTDSASRLFTAQEGYWIVNPDAGTLHVFEYASSAFSPFQKALEQNLDTLASGSATEGHAVAAASTTKPLRADQSFPYVNLCLILINVVIFLIDDLLLGLTPQGSGALQEQGALSWYQVIQDHQYYRMISSMFLHSGLDHIFNNMLVLGFIGCYVEKELGHIRYCVLYFLSGILAGITSMVYNMMQSNITSSVGASGAIFGIMGGLLMIVLVKHGRGMELNYRQILFMAFLSLYGGFTSQNVDNAAHVGGIVSGFLLAGLLLLTLHRQNNQRNRRMHYE